VPATVGAAKTVPVSWEGGEGPFVI
jgi:hypothetical protein